MKTCLYRNVRKIAGVCTIRSLKCYPFSPTHIIWDETLRIFCWCKFKVKGKSIKLKHMRFMYLLPPPSFFPLEMWHYELKILPHLSPSWSMRQWRKNAGETVFISILPSSPRSHSSKNKTWTKGNGTWDSDININGRLILGMHFFKKLKLGFPVHEYVLSTWCSMHMHIAISKWKDTVFSLITVIISTVYRCIQYNVHCTLNSICTIQSKLWIEKTNDLVDIETDISRNLKGLVAIKISTAVRKKSLAAVETAIWFFETQPRRERELDR